ncbi:sigma-70 family RNA polymerase sigma factor [Adhaeribacter swui]|uniref:Sigma-70 family RNA polymerase sigma factor n=1 Tax=Adhaeribacter swui TaxID=2086471 RepID=A0A7G7G2T9_9BACT|nr:sigma-70 family RNA polymerase sigma factor [Adhaeribacter swui]QNF31473.1 sigma-70 family RNA polymerase sigma factor [Adhaeribacter swui]
MHLVVTQSKEDYLVDYSLQTDSEIWNDFKKGEELAFSYIYHKFYNDLYYYGMKITNADEIVQDAIQELFASLWKNKAQLGYVQAIKFYLLKSLRRGIIRHLERDKKYYLRANIFGSNQPDIAFSEEEITILEETSLEKRQHISNLLNALSKRQKEVIYLKYYENLEFDEIAELMALNYQSVINHIHKAFKKLRQDKEFARIYLAGK